MAKQYPLGDDEELWFGVDWTPWLDGDTISTSIWIVPATLTNLQDQASATGTTVMLTIATAAIGDVIEVTNIITTTSTAETAERTLKIKIVEDKYK